MGSQVLSSAEKSASGSLHSLSVRTYKDKTYYSVPQAAKVIGVSRMTVLRWVRKIREGHPEIDGIQIEGFRDVMSGRFFVSADSIQALKERERPLISN
jgi:hypothetical protein